MSDLLSKLMNLSGQDWSDPAVSFGFERPLPAWAWAGVVLAATGLALWSYSRLTGRAWARAALGVVRAVVLVLVVALVCGPQLVRRQELSENDWVLVLVDRSLSLTVEDVPGEHGAGRRSRESQLESALIRAAPVLEKLSSGRTVLWLGFDAGVRDLKPGATAGVPEVGPPDGRRTSLGAALDQALSRAAARPVAGVVIVSDGRSSDEPTRQAMRRLEGEKIPVICVPLGLSSPIGDLAVKRADGPRRAFVNDPASVRVELERTGSGAGGAVARLIDKLTGEVLDERPVEFAPGDESGVRRASLTLAGKGAVAGPVTWVVEVSPDAGSDGPDLVSANNSVEMSLELIDRPLRVLYVDGYPRWEQRYLKNLLVREKSISCSTLILAPDKKFIQEGDTELDALPDSTERWAEFDAVILGDVRPDVFTKEQLGQLKEHVAQRGGGLIWVAGPSATPLTWYSTVLADLLPFNKDAVDGTTLASSAVMVPTPEARRLGLLRLTGAEDPEPWPGALSSFETGWSQLRWVQRIDPSALKPTTETLATARLEGESDDRSGRGHPVLLAMKFGAGRVIYCATDEIWRWRYGRGEALYERFWTPLVRLLGRDALSRSGRSVVLEASPARAVVDQPVRVVMELLDQSLVDAGLGSVGVRLTRNDDPSATATEVTLRPEGTARAGSTGQPGVAPVSRSYSSVWIPGEPGVYTAQSAESVFAGRVPAAQLSTSIRVSLPDDELRAPEADHGLLARLARDTGGVVLQPENLSELPVHLPNRRVRVVNESTTPLWDTPLALILSVFLLTLEWVCRRVIRLV